MNPALVVATGGKVLAFHRLQFPVPKDRYLKLGSVTKLLSLVTRTAGNSAHDTAATRVMITVSIFLLE
jgi:hypothetical protein